MSVTINAGLFWVVVEEVSRDDVERICEQYINNRKTGDVCRVVQEDKEYEMTGGGWDAETGILTGTLWRVRKRRLPSKLLDGHAEALGLGDREQLGEPASFAFVPKAEKMLIEYNHTGPRHGVMRGVLSRMGLGAPVLVSPVIETGAVERMQDADLVRRIEFGLSAGDNGGELAKADEAVGHAIDAMGRMEGYSIKVEISMGHHKGSLGNAAKYLAASLAEWGRPVRTLKAGIKETEEQGMEILDLLGGRVSMELEVPESGREIDHGECRRLLSSRLRVHVQGQGRE